MSGSLTPAAAAASPRAPAAAPYVGRFAPSPSGPLHPGSIVTALGSFLQARVAGGRWLVRIDDIDPPREKRGAADAILRELERCALTWDGPVVYQHTRLEAYREAVACLIRSGLVFHCTCSRGRLDGRIYPGTCRERREPPAAAHALRVRMPAARVTIEDRLQGPTTMDLARDIGDVVIWRADGHPAYHLAVVVDDAWQGITEVVRGADLLDSTPCHWWLQQALGLPHPRWGHLPLALDAGGAKLSKETAAAPITGVPVSLVLSAALDFLGHPPPGELRGAPPAELLAWAQARWQLARVPRAARQLNASIADSNAARSSA